MQEKKKKTVKEKEDKAKKEKKKAICQFMEETFVLQVGEVGRIGGKRKEG